MGLELFAHDATTWSPLVKDKAAEGVGGETGGEGKGGEASVQGVPNSE